MLKKFSNKPYKKCPLFLSRAPSHNSFTFNLRFLCELKRKVCLSKTVRGSFRFRFHFVFIKVIFLFNKKHRPFDVIIPFKTKIIAK